MRDWLHVADNCGAINLVAHRGDSGEIYNIASGEEHMNIDVAKIILRILKKPESLINSVLDRPGHDCRYSLNTSKIKKLGWKPETGFTEGLEKTVSWYLKSEWWWRSLMKDKFFKENTPWLGKP